jgi:rsbT co-antagonist protein RsbR
MRTWINWLMTVRTADEDAQRRGSIVILISAGLVVTCLLLIPFTMFSGSGNAIGITVLMIGCAIMVASLLIARSGRVMTGAVIVIAMVILGSLVPILSTGAISVSLFFVALTPLIASLTLRPRHIWVVLIINLLGIALFVLAMPGTPLTVQSNRSNLITGTIFLGLISMISYLGADRISNTIAKLRDARGQIEEYAASLGRSNEDLERRIAERTSALQDALSDVQRRAEEQSRLLDEVAQQRMMIRHMSVPAIPVSDTTTIIPLVGALDGDRLEQLNEQALQTIERTGVRHLILDITGVVLVDSQVAQGIIFVVQSARLLGAQVILVGVRPEVAQAIVQLGLALDGIATFSTLQAALGSIHARN